MIGRGIATLAIIAFGYVVAVCAATIVTVALILTFLITMDSGAAGAVSTLLGALPAILMTGFVWTFFCAFPGFVVAILLGERQGWDRWRSYAVAGLVNAAAALAIFAVFVDWPFASPAMVAASFPGGFAGGAAYWAGAGRLAVRRRRLAA